MVLSIFGVPRQVAGIGDGMTYGSNLAVLQWFCGATINPLTHFLGEHYTEKVAPRYDPKRRRIRAYWPDCTPDDPVQTLAENQAYLTAGVLTINEVRQELGREPYEGFGDMPILPMGVSEYQGFDEDLGDLRWSGEDQGALTQPPDESAMPPAGREDSETGGLSAD